MDHDIAVVEENPAAVLHPLDPEGNGGVLLFQAEANPLGDGLDLAVRAAGGEDQVVGQGRKSAHLKDADMVSLFFEGVGGAEDCPIFRLQGDHDLSGPR